MEQTLEQRHAEDAQAVVVSRRVDPDSQGLPLVGVAADDIRAERSLLAGGI
ncbi:MAG TPA: hypothetical protein VIY27_13395 [Myxococcota bacterium]